ncbi:signal peptidase I [Terricaulis silvestris]|uniref:Signal peptidase I n=1 Tax=Terricaulis silvestris TaxID=2686094 RepID=A0A6I6MRA7_9CAUL|nr:signal peptidase I [Terricaulis silvestris]QGZ95317.1 Signal peptidase I [Terricaulis silvestris]
MSMSTTSSSSQQPAMDVFWDNVKTILYALALAMVLRFTIAQPFRIPSGSMQPTLEVGDYIVVTKWSYGYGRFSFAPLEGLLPRGRLFGSQPQRGDVVVFRPLPEPDRDFIKRLIGMPGDRIQVINGAVHINGEPITRESLGAVSFENEAGFVEQIPAWRETLPNGVSYTTFDKNPRGELDNTRVFVVPDGNYFMMGDDRDNSADSRVPSVVGFVPYDNLVGPAQFTVVSFDSSTSIFRPWTLFTGFRGERFLKSVN